MSCNACQGNFAALYVLLFVASCKSQIRRCKLRITASLMQPECDKQASLLGTCWLLCSLLALTTLPLLL